MIEEFQVWTEWLTNDYNIDSFYSTNIKISKILKYMLDYLYYRCLFEIYNFLLKYVDTFKKLFDTRFYSFINWNSGPCYLYIFNDCNNSFIFVQTVHIRKIIIWKYLYRIIMVRFSKNYNLIPTALYFRPEQYS